MLICVIGDATLDVIAGVPGSMRPGGDAQAQISLGVGGQGANVAVRLARRGLRVRLVAAMADDRAGNVIRAALRDEGLEVWATAAARSSMVVSLVGADGERTMLSDRRPILPIDGEPGGALTAALRDADWVHVSGYVLRDDSEGRRIVEAVSAARPGVVSVGGGAFETPIEARTALEASREMTARLLLFSREDAARMFGSPSMTATAGAAVLGSDDRLAVVTNGARGSAAAGLGLREAILVPPVRVRHPTDATGAGDAFAAALLAGLVADWPPDAARIASALADASRAGGAATKVRGAQGRLPGERPAATHEGSRSGE